MAMRTTTLIEALREMMREKFPTAPMATDYEFGYSLGQIWRYHGEAAFTYGAHERLAFLGLYSDLHAELGKGYRDGFFRHAHPSTREQYEAAEGFALRRLIRKQLTAWYPPTHKSAEKPCPPVAVLPKIWVDPYPSPKPGPGPRFEPLRDVGL